jgi:putative oxidoreductase
MTNNVLLLAGRFFLAVLFVVSGAGKFAMADQIGGMLGQMGLPAPVALAYLVGLCEVAGGVALVVGFQTRVVGLLLAGWCILTGIAVHGGQPIDLMKNIGLAGGFLLLAATSPGTLAYYGNWPERRAVRTAQEA